MQAILKLSPRWDKGLTEITHRSEEITSEPLGFFSFVLEIKSF